MTIYHMINWFFLFSFLGYLLECAVLTYENRTPVINRGFGHGPFCIIYGFGAMGACLLLKSMAGDTVRLYFASMAMATGMEFLTAHIMIRLFGTFWWDYSRKPFNYRGMICLESSVAWGFLGIFFFRFLNGFAHQLVRRVPGPEEKFLALGLLAFYVADFLYTMKNRLNASPQEEEVPPAGRLKVY